MCRKKRHENYQLPAFLISILFVLAIQIVGIGCGKSTEPKNNPSGSLTNSSGCISFLSTPKASVVPPCCTGLSYDYDSEAGILSVTHFGAGFNCCTYPSAEITFNDSLILIDENESGEYCSCLCLFNIEYEFENITPGVYTIRFIEIYVGDEELPLELTFDLVADPTGFISVERNNYPWDNSSNPVGKVIDISGCGGFQAGKVGSDSSACINFSYDGDSVLTLVHTNAIFNCCPDTLWADFNTGYNLITIEEKESTEIMGGCDCICNYDFNYIISDVTPGYYTIKIVEPYLSGDYDELILSIGFYSDTSGSFCVDRPFIGVF